jgi:hypothetical protein
VREYREEPKLYNQLAKTYAAQGKIALQHMALAESYVLTGATPAAVDQLDMARKAKDVSFYDQAVIDARERALQEKQKEEKKDKKEKDRDGFAVGVSAGDNPDAGSRFRMETGNGSGVTGREQPGFSNPRNDPARLGDPFWWRK